jgi:hypothetical protein
MGRGAVLRIDLSNRYEDGIRRLGAVDDTPPITLRFTSPGSRSTRDFALPWVESFCPVSQETDDAAWKSGCIGVYQENALFAEYRLKSPGRRLIREAPTEIVNVRSRSVNGEKFDPWFDVYCGRPSPLGNRFRIERDTPQDRAEAVKKFTAWLDTQERLRLFASHLKGLRIGCWCMDAPQVDGRTEKLCHCVAIACAGLTATFDSKGFVINSSGDSEKYAGNLSHLNISGD